MLEILQGLLQVQYSLGPRRREFVDPAAADFGDRQRIEVMSFFPAVPVAGNEPSILQDRQVSRGRLPAHVQVARQIAKRLALIFVQAIQQAAPGWICQGFEYLVHSIKAAK